MSDRKNEFMREKGISVMEIEEIGLYNVFLFFNFRGNKSLNVL